MDRADVGDTELAQRMDVSRVTVHRWREAESLPREETVRQLKTELRWVDDAGVVRELADAELDELLVAAGYHTAPTQPQGDRSIQAERCTVYAASYTPETFPSSWSRRVIELERGLAGSLYTMANTLSSITRSAGFYRGAYESGLYQQDQVKAYMALHEQRQQAFLKRLETTEVHHLYSQQGVETFLRHGMRESGSTGNVWNVVGEILVEQLERTISWLEEYENFEVRLRPFEVAGNLTIIGHDVVLVSLSPSISLMAADSVTGLELAGADAAVQFTKQFRSLWADQGTTKGRQEVIGWLGKQREQVLQGQ